MEKFEDRADKGIFLGYSTKSKAYKCYNKCLMKIVKSSDMKVVEHGTYAHDDDSDVEVTEVKETLVQEQDDNSLKLPNQSTEEEEHSTEDSVLEQRLLVSCRSDCGG